MQHKNSTEIYKPISICDIVTKDVMFFIWNISYFSLRAFALIIYIKNHKPILYECPSGRKWILFWYLCLCKELIRIMFMVVLIAVVALEAMLWPQLVQWKWLCCLVGLWACLSPDCEGWQSISIHPTSVMYCKLLPYCFHLIKYLLKSFIDLRKIIICRTWCQTYKRLNVRQIRNRKTKNIVEAPTFKKIDLIWGKECHKTNLNSWSSLPSFKAFV